MSPNLRKAVLALAGATVMCTSFFAGTFRADAEIVPMPPHEKSYVAPNGITFMVGNRDEFINRIPPLNMVGTTREALVSSVAYGRLDGGTGGRIRVGYHVGCGVALGSGTVGISPDYYIDLPDGVTPGDPNVGPVATLTLTPGEVVDVAMMEKTMVPGKLINLGIRDYHIRVNSCLGPVNIRQYTYVLLESEDTDDSGAVFGEPTWL